MNIKDELNERVYGWLEAWAIEEGYTPGSPKIFDLIWNNKDEFTERKLANYKKYNIIDIDEEDNKLFGISDDESLIRVPIYNKEYLVACAQRLYCILGEYKWRHF